MADFRPVTDRELKILRGLTATERHLRRLEVRLAIKRARIRVAHTLKAARPMRTVTDIRWHSEVTAREARALRALASGLSARRVFRRVRDRMAAALQR